MSESTGPRWLEWAQQLQALAQTGLQHTDNPFDVHRYEAVRRVAAEMIADGTEKSADEVEGLFTDLTGDATPKVDVRAIVFRDGKVLLVRELSDGRRWTLPGGWCDVGDSPSESAVREVREETGYEVRATKVLAVWDRSRHDHPPGLFYSYKLYFLCDLVGGEAENSVETEDPTFFAEDEIPDDLSIGRVTRKQIARFFEHARNPDWPTDFD